MPHADLVDDRIVVATDWADKDLIKQVPGMRWSEIRGTQVWNGTPSFATCRILRGVFGQRLTVAPALNDWVWNERVNRIDPCLQLRGLTGGIEYDITSTSGFRLLDFQGPGVAFLTTSQRCLLADEMGTGKTVQAVVGLRVLREAGFDAFPVFAAVPNSTKTTTWKATWNEWDPAVQVFTIGGQSAKVRGELFAEAKALSDSGVPVAVVMNWEAVRLHSRLAPYGNVKLKRCSDCGGPKPLETEDGDEVVVVKPAQCQSHPKELNAFGFKTVIADEAHKMKDPKSQQTRAVKAVMHGELVRYAWALTGTPLANDPGDLWSIMNGVAPLEYPSKTKYTDRFALMSWNAFGGLDIVGIRPDTRDEFFDILDPRMRRMPKELVLPFLPPKSRTVRHCDMSAAQRKAYHDIADGHITRLDDGSLVLTSNNLTAALRMLQFSSAYATVNELNQVKLTDPSSKIDEVFEILDELGDKPVVVCAESRQLIELAVDRIEKHNQKKGTKPITYRKIVGGMTDDQRTTSLADFQEGRARVMFFTIKAGGVGLTMTAADTIVFMQRSWSMLENVQAEDRVHRIGSEIHESINVIDLVAPGTIEEDQIARLLVKANRLQEIVRDKETLQNAAAGGDAAAIARLTELEAEKQAILASDLTGNQTPGFTLVGEDAA